MEADPKTSLLQAAQTNEQPGAAAEQPKDRPRAAVVRVNILDLLAYDDNNLTATMKVFVEVSWQVPELLQEPDCPRNARWTEFEEVPRSAAIKKTAPLFLTKVLNTRLQNLIEDKDIQQYFVIKNDKDEPEGRFESVGIGSDVPILSWVALGTGVFRQTVDFSSYPFDQQSVEVKVNIAEKRLEKGFRVLQNTFRPCTLHDTNIEGWHLEKGKEAHLTFENRPRDRDHIVSFGFLAARAPMFYVINFVVPPSLVTLLAMLAFALPVEDLADRSALVCTMFLTQVAFKSALTSYIPKVSYLTYLDKYIFLQTIMLILAAVVQTATFLVQRDAEHPLAENIALGVLLAIWVFALLQAACRAGQAGRVI